MNSSSDILRSLSRNFFRTSASDWKLIAIVAPGGATGNWHHNIVLFESHLIAFGPWNRTSAGLWYKASAKNVAMFALMWLVEGFLILMFVKWVIHGSAAVYLLM